MMYLCWILLLCVALAFTVFANEDIQEYCEREWFEASCGSDEVIMMTSAKFGRMRRGRCVKTIYGSLGCAADAIRHVDALCSGRRECRFLVSDLHSFSPCPDDLISYLETSYRCIKVTPCAPGSCSRGNTVSLRPESGILASVVTAESESHCGSSSCPWIISPNPGQRFNFTVYNFYKPTESMADRKFCHRFAAVKDSKTDISKDVTVCGHEGRTSSFVSSISSSVEIQFYSGKREETSMYFIMEYEMLGCPDIEPPSGGWVSRSGENVVVRCNNTQKSWHLTCGGTSWVGQIGVCNEDLEQPWSLVAALEEAGSTPQGLLVVVCLGIAMGVILGFSMLGVTLFLMRRRERNKACTRRGPIAGHKPEQIGEDSTSQTLTDPSTASEKQFYMKDGVYYKMYQPGSSRRNSGRAYCTSLLEPPPPPPPPGSQLHTTGTSSVGRSLDRSSHMYESPTFT